MKALRILQGLHAGAWLTLAPGRYCIAGTDAAAEAGVGEQPDVVPIRLYDWTHPPLLLRVDADGRVTAGPPGDSQHWADLKPHRLGDVVLCTGDADQRWPSDAALMALLQAPGRGRTVLAAWMHSWSARALLVGAGLLVAVGGLYGRADGGTSALPPPQAALGAQWLSRSLTSRGLDELQIRQEHQTVVLSGLVRDVRQGQAVRLAVADVEEKTGIPVSQAWEVADEIAATIESALRVSGLHVSYLGNGRFGVGGTVPDPVQVRDATAQLRKDLGVNVRGIDFDLARIPAVAQFTTAIAADALRYSERPDGAKVFAEKKL